MNNINREQTEVLEAKGNVLVSASAGSGKTTVMIEKIFRLIQAGYEVSRMAVMTFSKASAAEMKNRLVKKLYDAVRNGTEEESARALRQLDSFPFANISTIDSFCFSIIKKYYAVTGVNPSATPLDPDESDLMWGECVDKACEQELNNPFFVAFAEKYSSSRRLDRVKEFIKDLKTFLDVQPDRDKFLKEDFFEKRLEFVVNEYRFRLREILNSIDKTVVVLHDLKASQENDFIALKKFIKDMLNEESPIKFLENATFFLAPPALSRQKIYNSVRNEYNEIRDTATEIMEWLANLYRLSREKNDEKEVEVLFCVTEKAIKLYSERKRRDDKLDFNDLNRMALEILKDEDTAREIKDSFDFIFVDEYQDTNYLQEELLRGISRNDNVFVVGDVKQAIYKFRYAEPEIFNERMTRYLTEGTGRNIHLNKNYRSKASILEFVNDVCSEVMTEEYSGSDYAQNPMVTGAEFAEEKSGVEIYLYDNINDKPINCGVYSVMGAETEEEEDIDGDFVATKIEELVEFEEIYRPKTGRTRKVEYGDIAVLTRKGSEGLKIAKALSKRYIPYTVNDEDKSSFYPRELLVDFLRMCVCEEDVPLVNTLSCPIFGLSTAEIMEITQREPNTSIWVALNRFKGNKDTRQKVKKYLDYVENLRNLSAYLTATDVMTKILSDGLDGYFDSLGEEVGGRLAKFIDNVRNLESNKNISDFIDYYDSSYKGEKPPAKPNSVVIMTMHKSKGLQFPIVFLPYCHGVSERSVHTSMFFADKELGVGLKFVDEDKSESKDTFATFVLKLKKLCDGRRELARLMYVDFTRAENKLIITGARTKPKQLCDVNSIMGFIEYAAQRNARIKTLYRDMPEDMEIEADEPDEEEEELDFSYLGEAYGYAESTVLPNKQSVSEILETDAEVSEKGKFPFGYRGRGGSAELGTAYHLYMQKADLSKNDDISIKSFLSELVKNNEISEETAEKMEVEKIRDLLKTEIISLAVKNKIYREQPFISTVRGKDGYTLVQGVIDLLIEEEDGFTVVDFKASGLDEERLASRYGAQLNIYADATERIFGKKVKRKVLLNILRNYAVEVE